LASWIANMSKLFEALSKGQDLLPNGELNSLVDGQVDKTTPPAPAISLFDEEEIATAPIAQSHHFQGAIGSARVVTLQVAPLAPILPFDGTHSGAGEQYRMLRTRISQNPKSPQVIAITSSGPNDGKSVTAVNLAGALALKGEQRVLLIDGDFRRSTIADQLGLNPTPGLAEILTGQTTLHEALIQAQQIAPLFILPAGEPSGNPVELLDCSLWREFLEYCRAEFKYIIIDSPPLGVVADYDLIQASCDGAILVVRPDHTDRQLTLKALTTIPKDKFIGVVLNCVEPWFLHRQRTYPGYYHYPARTSQSA